MAAVTGGCVAFAASATALVDHLTGHPFLPDLYLAVGIPLVLAPAGVFSVVRLLKKLEMAEKAAENALRETETRLHALARQSPVGLFETDASGRCIHVTERWCAITGLEATETTRQAWLSAIHPEDRDRVGREWRIALEQQQPFSSEHRFQRPDGSVTWVLTQAEPRHDSSNRLTAYVGTVTDITAVKRAEAALRKTNRALTVLSQCNQALVRIDSEEKLLREICRIIVEAGGYRLAWVGFAENDERRTVRPVAQWGYEEGYLESIRVTWADEPRGRGPVGSAIRALKPQVAQNILHDAAFAPWREPAMKRGYAACLGLPLHAGGHVFGALALYAPEPDAFDEEETRLLLNLADNTAYGILALRARVEQMKAESAIRDSEERFRATFEQAAVGVAHISPDGRYSRVNEKLCEITGYSRDELLQRRFQQLTHPDDLEADLSQVHQVLRGEIPTYSMEKRYFRKDGALIWVNRTLSLVRDAKGEPQYFISVIQDITERKATEEQLRQAQKMEVVGQLTGGVAHDFNNLLAIILGNLELVEERLREESSLRRLVERGLTAADRAAALTQRLLAFSRKQVLQPRVTDVNAMILDMLDLMRRSLGEDVSVQTVLAGDLWSTHVDPGQMETVLLNLAINARDAMPAGGKLVIETANVRLDPARARKLEVRPGEYVCLIVRDTGVGMPPEVARRAFEPFFTTKDVGKGSGLGLSMVYGFVKQSNGHVSISSREGGGTKVRIHLPRAPEAVEQKRETESFQEPAAQGEVVLVVEDDPEVRTLAVTQLRDLGYTVYQAGGTDEALSVLDDIPELGLLLTDVMLTGGISGLDLAAEIQRVRPEAKAIFMSGYTEAAIAHAGHMGRDLLFLQKPFRKTDLARQVRAALEPPAL